MTTKTVTQMMMTSLCGRNGPCGQRRLWLHRDESAPSRGPRRPAPGAGLGKNLSCVLKIFVYCRESRAKRQLHHGGGWRCRQPLRVAVAITQDTRGLDLKSTPASWLRPRPNAPPSSRSPEVRSLRRDTRAFPGKAGRLLGE